MTQDAVVVVPGIMGSELRDAETGDLLWGLSVRLLERAWRRGDGLKHLHVTPEELDGHTDRVRATCLLAKPAWAPFLLGIEPYADLVWTVEEAAAAPEAVRAFPYDWRLPVEHNGALLAAAARQHLEQWRAQVEENADLRALCEDRAPRLVFVAHSMGGLVTRAALAGEQDLIPDTRAVVTLGTPFLGAAKTAIILNGDRANPTPTLPPRRMQALAATLPGVHDLLPDYRCLDEGLEVARLSPETVGAIGGSKELAARAQEFQTRMRTTAPALPGHRAVVGVAQPTVQSLRIENGIVRARYEAFRAYADGELRRNADGVPERHDRAGDGTVYRDSASIGTPASMTYLPVQHGALAKHSTALRYVHAVLTEHDEHLGPPMGAGELGLVLPEEGVPAGQAWTLHVTGTTSPAGVICHVVDAATGRAIARPRLSGRDGGLAAQVTLPDAGLYRVGLESGGSAAVTQLVLAIAPEDVD
ncbi:hypothetical protein [Streptomyces sp. NPDC088733]|uniref:lipase/acyltransferase domain-containing protein n=1 Tax=Streptomyces sp. NPDC088733 TaxID=3365880 RepID=UPI0037F2BB55